jgi:hypothetical protein
MSSDMWKRLATPEIVEEGELAVFEGSVASATG